MKIKVTEERECCALQDMRQYNGGAFSESPSRRRLHKFCVHCGQRWVEESAGDAAGGVETRLVQVRP